MRNAKRFWIALGALGVIAMLPACNSALDDSGSADVVLEIMTITGQPVQSQDNGAGGGCTFTVNEWTAQLRNQPKNELATQSPFGDIRLVSVLITYVWDDAFPSVPRELPLAGTVPASGTQSITFQPILLGDLDSSREGHSANMTMLFQGRTVDDNAVSAYATGKTLTVNSCITSGP